ncbi:toxin-antitoxin system YwqK family antitoxin [Owenweeksia hongkongensis]|uniref:toxin-antitoxin system YwqK family antitoxin n=1 Tax=Owenweeksia hongkongensis TaxID=253245 RepID=UPI003A934AB8
MILINSILLLVIVICVNSCGGEGIDDVEAIHSSSEVKYEKELYPDGQLKSKIELNSEGLRDGEALSFYHSGAVINKAIFKNGIRVGENFVYYEDSSIKIKEVYNESGELHGVYEEYFENGILKKKGRFEDGNMAGEWKEYYENGELYEPNQMKNGELEGIQKVFHTNGQLGVIGLSQGGLEEGEWIYLDLDGDTLKEEYYEKGKLVRSNQLKPSKKAVE